MRASFITSAGMSGELSGSASFNFAISRKGVLASTSYVQYDWFIILQVFGFGLLLGWMRWVSGSTLLTMLLHGVINCEGMIETLLSLQR